MLASRLYLMDLLGGRSVLTKTRNLVWKKYRKLWTEFFPRLMAQARSARAMKKEGEKRGSITYGTVQANEVNKMFIIWL